MKKVAAVKNQCCEKINGGSTQSLVKFLSRNFPILKKLELLRDGTLGVLKIYTTR